LVYHFDALRQLGTMVREFLGCELPGMVNRNLGQEKLYSEHYNSIKKSLRLPAEFVMRRYNSKLANHFFSPQELAGFVRRWSEANPGDIALAETGFANGAGLAPKAKGALKSQ
jgi:hypothetical protein